MKKPDLTCTLCYPDAVDIGEIASCVWLAKIKGRYVLFFGQGHEGDILHTFKIKPYDDPTKKDRNCDKEETMDRHSKAVDYCNKHFPKISSIEGYKLVKTCMKTGYYRPKTHGLNFDLWLFFKCGELIDGDKT